MEAPLQAQYGAPLEPLGLGLGHPANPHYHTDPQPCPSANAETGPLYVSPVSPIVTATATHQNDNSTLLDSTSTSLTGEEGEEEECLVDSQPICFSENPFLVANRKSKGRPPKERILSGPPVGYGKQGQLQPWLYSKARSLPACAFEAAWCVTAL